MTTKEVLQKIESHISEWLDLNFVSETVAIGDCLCDKKHKMLYSKSTNTFSCPHCGYQNLTLFDLTQLAMKSSGNQSDVIIKIIKKYFNGNVEMINSIKDAEKENNALRSSYIKINEEALKFFQASLKENKQAMDYLYSRGFTEKTILQFGIGYAPMYNVLYKKLKEIYSEEMLECIGLIGFSEKTQHYYDVFRDRVMFPIYGKDNELVGFSGRIISPANEKVNPSAKPIVGSKYVNTKVTPLFVKNEILYNLNNIKKNEYPFIYVCEGFMDVIALKLSGINNVVCTMGTAFTHKHLAVLKEYTQKIVLLFDGDDAGVNAAKRTIAKMDEEFSVLFLKEDLDPDEFIKKYGVEEFKRYAKENTKSWTTFSIDNFLKNKSSDDQKTSFL